jgi:hypothetical protein
MVLFYIFIPLKTNDVMHKPLKKFSAFAAALLPFECDYLLGIHQLQDPENIRLLKIISHNSRHPAQTKPYPQRTDKRKYSYLKKWITEKLEAINVDIFYEWLSQMDQRIMTDALNPEDEKRIIKIIRQYQKPDFYFIRFYELVQNYQNFLLIRVRQQYYELASAFLEKYKFPYERSRHINQRLHQATRDIVRQYSEYDTEAAQWEKWLLEVFYEEEIDGLNRYLALVRLVFLYYNYKDYHRLIGIFEDLEKRFIQGEMYSPRILANYYANRLLVHSRNNELDLAETYGYLSIRYHSNDYLYYLVNLCAVLLRKGKYTGALQLLNRSFPELKKSNSPHTRVGFIAYYIQALWRNGRAAEAVSYAQTTLQTNRDDIMQHRWHLFFSSYFLALLAIEKYRDILSLARRYKLLEKDKQSQKRAGYVPNLIWMFQLASYKQLAITREKLYETLYETALPCLTDHHKFFILSDLCNDLKIHDIEVFDRLHHQLFRTQPEKMTPRFFV